MKNAVFSGLNQIVKIHAIAALAVMTTIVFISSTDTLIRTFREMPLLPCGYHTDFLLIALQSDIVASFIPILSVLTFSANYVDDIKNKFARYFLVRSSCNTYILSRMLVCFLCGGFVIFGGIMLAWGISALLFLPMEKVTESYSDSTVLLLKTSWLLFLKGGLWAIVGMAMSTIMESKYIAYASSFVLYYLTIILYERYLPEVFLINPKNWINPEVWPYGCWGATVFLMELSLLFSFLFAFRAGSRLEEL